MDRSHFEPALVHAWEWVKSPETSLRYYSLGKLHTIDALAVHTRDTELMHDCSLLVEIAEDFNREIRKKKWAA